MSPLPISPRMVEHSELLGAACPDQKLLVPYTHISFGVGIPVQSLDQKLYPYAFTSAPEQKAMWEPPVPPGFGMQN